MSPKDAGLALKKGYTNIRVFLDGQPAWIKAGNPVYASVDFIQTGNIVLIDLRPVAEAVTGRIPGSVSIPSDSLDDRMDALPIKAPIVLYGESAEEAVAVFEDLLDEGFKKVSLVPGGYSGWVRAGRSIAAGPVVADISWTRKLEKGEVSREDFLLAVNGKKTDTLILDVRTPEETAAGGFPGAVAIPLDQLASRITELPRDKRIYVHCATGSRAEMGAKQLKEKGYEAFYLVAECQCKGAECRVED